jgi:hypothetical protein
MAGTDFRSLANLDMSRNRLVSAALELVSVNPSPSVLGQIAFSQIPGPTNNHAYLCIDASTPVWVPLISTGQNESIYGLWTFAPPNVGAPSGPPFAVANADPATNKVTNLNADYLDGFGTSDTVAANSIPVRISGGRVKVGTPTENDDAATKAYVDNLASGNRPVTGGPVRCATVADFAGTYSAATNAITASANGPISGYGSVFDGITTLIVGQRVLVRVQANAAHNGIYSVTNSGGIGSPVILTRTIDADDPSEVTTGATAVVTEGTVNQGAKFRQANPIANVDTDPENWVLDSVTSLVAGPGIHVAGNKISFVKDGGYGIGSLFYADTTASIAELPIGAAGKVLGVSGGKPTWTDVAVTGLPTLEMIAGGDSLISLSVTPTGPRPQLGQTALAWTFSASANFGTLYGSPQKLVGMEPYVYPADAGTSSKVLREDAQLRISAAILPTWSARHTFDAGIAVRTTAAATSPWLAVFDSDPTAGPAVLKSRTQAQIQTDLQIPVPGEPVNLVGILPKATGTNARGTAYLAFDCTLQIDQAIAPNWTGLHSFVNTSPSTVVLQTKTSAGAAFPTWGVSAGGTVKFGDGFGPMDVDLYRIGLGELNLNALFDLKASAATLSDTSQILLFNSSGLTTAQRVVQADKTSFKNWLGASSSSKSGALSTTTTGTIGVTTLSGGAIGTGDFTLAVKLKWPAANSTAIAFASITSAATTSGVGAFDFGLLITTSNGLQLYWRDAGQSQHLSSVIPMASYLGKTIDIAAVRTAGVQSVYINGVNQSYTPVDIDDSSLANGASTLYFRIFVGLTGGTDYPEPMYSARLFNRALTGAEVSDLNENGIAHTDQWGSLSGPVPGCLMDSDIGAICGTVIPNRSGSGDGTLTGTVEVVNNHLHCIGDTVSGDATAVPFVSSTTRRLTSDSSKLAWNGTRFSVFGEAHVQSATGIGIVPAAASWLELAPGTTSKAPIRFGTGSLLTTPVSGSVENNGTRLWYTDSTPTRRGIAFIDDANFTSDGTARPGGAVILGPLDRITASLGSELIGTDPISIWVRFLVPRVFRGPGSDCVVSVNGGGVGAGFTYAASIQITSSGQLRFEVSANGADQVQVNVANVIATYGGTIIDAVVVRDGTTPYVYINGRVQTTTGSSSGAGTWAQNIVSNKVDIGMFYSGLGSVPRVHRVVVYNRALRAQDAADLNRTGLSELDQWGSTIAIATTDFTSGAGGWASVNSGNAPLLTAQTVNGSPGWATLTLGGSNGRMDVEYALGSLFQYRKFYALRATLWHATAQPAFFGSSISGLVTDSPLKQAASTSSETTLLLPTSTQGASAAGAIRLEPGDTSANTGAVTLTVGTSYGIKNPRVYQQGAIVDLNLGIGCGSVIPDFSGRYHGSVVGTTWTHYIPTCPVGITSGNGEVSTGLRRFVQRLVALSAAQTITHNLGTRDVEVQCWQDGPAPFNTVPAKIEVGITVESTSAVKIWPNVVPASATATVIVVG